jgi:hypothetical protein
MPVDSSPTVFPLRFEGGFAHAVRLCAPVLAPWLPVSPAQASVDTLISTLSGPGDDDR